MPVSMDNAKMNGSMIGVITSLFRVVQIALWFLKITQNINFCINSLTKNLFGERVKYTSWKEKKSLNQQSMSKGSVTVKLPSVKVEGICKEASFLWSSWFIIFHVAFILLSDVINCSQNNIFLAALRRWMS